MLNVTALALGDTATAQLSGRHLEDTPARFRRSTT
jgi:hypothetical protein